MFVYSKSYCKNSHQTEYFSFNVYVVKFLKSIIDRVLHISKVLFFLVLMEPLNLYIFSIPLCSWYLNTKVHYRVDENLCNRYKFDGGGKMSNFYTYVHSSQTAKKHKIDGVKVVVSSKYNG